MAHAIDTTTGKAAVMVTGAPAWHKLGVVVKEAQTSAEAIRLAGLDWEVVQCPLKATFADGQELAVTSRVANVRGDTRGVLGVVGDGYRVLQNREAFDFMDALVGERLAMFETAGAIFNGRRVWMLARIPKELRAGQSDDVVLPYVLLANGHDGGMAVRIMPTSVRVVCNNTLSFALSQSGGLRFTHSENVHDRIDAAREQLGLAVRRMDAFQTEIDALAGRYVTGAEVTDYFRQVFGISGKIAPPSQPAPVGGDGSDLLEGMLAAHEQRQALSSAVASDLRAEQTRREKNQQALVEQLLANFENSRNTLPGIKGTAWAAYNAVSEYVDHQQKARSEDARLNSIWFGAGAEVKQQAYGAALAMVH